MGLFDFLKKEPQKTTAPAAPAEPQYFLLPPEAVQVHNAPISQPNIKALKTDCFVLHFETTGLLALGDPSKKTTNQITAIKCARYKNAQLFDSFFSLVNPGRPIPSDATSASGIDAQMVANAPTIEQIFPQFMSYINDAIFGNTLILSFNAEFNSDFMSITMRRQNFPGEYRMLDVMKLADKKLRMSDFPTMKQAMKAMHIKDRELNADIHKCMVIAALAFALVDVPDNSVEV